MEIMHAANVACRMVLTLFAANVASSTPHPKSIFMKTPKC